MGNINKIISLVIGLTIVILLFAVLTGRINIRNQIVSLGKKKAVITPTPTKLQAKEKPTPTLSYKVNRYQQGVGGSTSRTGQIPATGIPVIFYTSLFAVLSAGIYLRKKK